MRKLIERKLNRKQMIDKFSLDLRYAAFPVGKRNVVEKHIDSIGGNVWKNRAYFPDELNLEAASKLKLQPYNAYYDLKTGDFVCTVSKPAYEQGIYESAEKYKNVYKDLMLKALRDLK